MNQMFDTTDVLDRKNISKIELSIVVYTEAIFNRIC